MENSNTQNDISLDEMSQNKPISSGLNPDDLEMMRQQFEEAPYPNLPLDVNPKDSPYILFHNSLVTAQYLRNQRVVCPEGKLILDVGCGSGYTSLILAEANPGSKIYGVDISEKSVELAQKRLAYHGFHDTQFTALSIYDLPKLDLKFDYINCSDVLYLLPDQLQGLQAMKAVLKPDGVIRANFHSLAQRFYIFQSQKLFRLMGLMEDSIGQEEVDIALSVINAVKDDVLMKRTAWRNTAELEEEIRANSLLQGDQGFSTAEVFSLLRQSNLELISMVEWRKWELMDLFKEPENLPPFLAMSLPECSLEDRLQLFELLQPTNRLIDFWCGHEGQKRDKQALEDWTDEQWQTATIYLNPQLKTELFREGLIHSLTYQSLLDISRYLPAFFDVSVLLDTSISSCLLSLWEGGQSLETLVNRWLTVRPINLVTLEPVNQETAIQEVQKFLKNLEELSCIFVDLPSELS